MKNDCIEIIDYKTGKTPHNKYLKNNLQLSIYFLAATNKGILNKKPDEILLTYLYLQDTNKVSFAKKSEEISNIEDTIINVVDNIQKNEFSPKKGKHCDFCPYKMICEAWQ